MSWEADADLLPGHRYTTLTRSRSHSGISDEPVGREGEDLGPSPVEMALWALGSCTAMTLRMYAERKGWPLEGVSVHINHQRLRQDECPDCPPSETGYVDKIGRQIRLEGPLDDAQRQRLMQIADHCPVARLLKYQPHIVDTLVAE